MELATDYKLGETRTEVNVSNAEENRNAAISLVRQAHRAINIFTQDLDAALYDNKEFEKHVFKLATRHRSVEIRILVQDSSRAIKNGHRLIRLAQKLTSSIFIKKPASKFKDNQSAFLTVDGVGMLYRTYGGSRSYDASVNFMSPQRTGRLDEFFMEVWEQSAPDPQVRRLFI